VPKSISSNGSAAAGSVDGSPAIRADGGYGPVQPEGIETFLSTAKTKKIPTVTVLAAADNASGRLVKAKSAPK